MSNVYINLPIKSVSETDAFFAALEMTKNHFFSSDDTTNARINDTTVLMLLEREKFEGFTKRPVPEQSNSQILVLQFDTVEEVDVLHAKALAAGATDTTDPNPESAAFMHLRAFRDVNDHAWEVFAFLVDLPPEATQG